MPKSSNTAAPKQLFEALFALQLLQNIYAFLDAILTYTNISDANSLRDIAMLLEETAITW